MTRKWIAIFAVAAGACDDTSTPPGNTQNAGATDGTNSDDATGTDDDGTVDDDIPTANNDTVDDGVDPDPLDPDPTNNTPDDPDPDPDPEPSMANGCGSAEGSGTWSLEHDGRDRELLVHVPDGYDPNTPTPVVINYHGRSMSARQQESFSEMTPVADDNGFIVVYPEGTGSLEQTWNAGLCCGSAQAQNVDDVGFTAAMLDELESNLCVDTDRVFTVGMSNGGFMSHRLGCELSDRITAIGAVAGTLAVGDCSPVRPVPVLHFHGTADNVVQYNGFVGPDSAPSTVERWASMNNCANDAEVYFDEGDVTCERWTGCDEGAEVRFCTIEGGGHTWPGGTDFTFGALGKTTDNISASEHFWEFFSGLSM